MTPDLPPRIFLPAKPVFFSRRVPATLCSLNPDLPFFTREACFFRPAGARNPLQPKSRPSFFYPQSLFFSARGPPHSLQPGPDFYSQPVFFSARGPPHSLQPGPAFYPQPVFFSARGLSHSLQPGPDFYPQSLFFSGRGFSHSLQPGPDFYPQSLFFYMFSVVEKIIFFSNFVICV